MDRAIFRAISYGLVQFRTVSCNFARRNAREKFAAKNSRRFSAREFANLGVQSKTHYVGPHKFFVRVRWTAPKLVSLATMKSASLMTMKPRAACGRRPAPWLRGGQLAAGRRSIRSDGGCFITRTTFEGG